MNGFMKIIFDNVKFFNINVKSQRIYSYQLEYSCGANFEDSDE